MEIIKGNCQAQVQFGNYTYAARNKSRQCGNKAQANGYCHQHQAKVVTPLERESFAELAAKLGL